MAEKNVIIVDINNFRVGDKVQILSNFVTKHFRCDGKIGTIIEIDFLTSYHHSYKIEFMEESGRSYIYCKPDWIIKLNPNNSKLMRWLKNK